MFAVQVAGKDALRSDVLKEGLPAVPAKVDLAGAMDFILKINDSGDL